MTWADARRGPTRPSSRLAGAGQLGDGPMTPTTRITRLPEKASTDRAELDRLLDDVHIGHFGVIDDGHPVVIPTAIVRDGDRVLAHGSTGSRWMRALAAGAPTSLAVTSFDGLVIARSAFESSMHYRSAVLFGSCTVVDDAEPRAGRDHRRADPWAGRRAAAPAREGAGGDARARAPDQDVVAEDLSRLARRSGRRRRRPGLGRRHPGARHLWRAAIAGARSETGPTGAANRCREIAQADGTP